MDKVINPRPSLVVIATTTVLLVAVIGGIGFVLGRDSAEPALAKSAAARVIGGEQVAARETAYDRGFAAGKQAARRDSGAGEKPSPRDALAIGGFALEPGSYYVVKVAAGDSGDARIDTYCRVAP